MISAEKKVWFVIGWLAMLGAVIGLLLPVVPASPLIILAAYAFSRSSKRYYGWLISLPFVGPMLDDWHSEGALGLKGKCLASFGMVTMTAVASWFLPGHVAWKFIVVLIGLGGMVFVWTRPSPCNSHSLH